MYLINELIYQHKSWAIPIIFFLAFSESLVFLSLILPASAILLALGALISAGGVTFWLTWASAAVGAFFGDWLSYWIGYHYQNQIVGIWPLSRNPQLLMHAHDFLKRWGILSIFIGRFFGPLRAVIPLVSGIYSMPKGYFQLANITSAIIWAFSILAPGALGIKWINQWLG